MIHCRLINFCFHAFSFSFHFHRYSFLYHSLLPLVTLLSLTPPTPLYSQSYSRTSKFFWHDGLLLFCISHSVLVEFQNIHCRLICWGIFVITTFQSFSVAFDSVTYNSVNLKFNCFHIWKHITIKTSRFKLLYQTDITIKLLIKNITKFLNVIGYHQPDLSTNRTVYMSLL